MQEQFVMLTDEVSNYTNVTAREIERVRGGLRPSSKKIKWYTLPSIHPEYYSEYQEYDRMDLSDGKGANDEVLDDGRYNPGTKYVMYSTLKDTTVRIRPTRIKEILSKVYIQLKDKLLPEDILRATLAREVGKELGSDKIKHLICEIDDISDVIVLEDIFAVSEAIDPVRHDILKNEIKLYVFDPHAIYHATDEKKYKAYMDVKNRIENGFYKKKLEFLDMVRWNSQMEPKTRDSYLRCGVYPVSGETAEQCYDRIKPQLEQLYMDFERYKDNYEDFRRYIIREIPRAILSERNDWDERYNDEAITEAIVQGYVKYFSGIYVSADAEKRICLGTDIRRRFRYNRSFNVTSLAIFDSEALELEKVIDIEEIRFKNIDAKKRQKAEEEMGR